MWGLTEFESAALSLDVYRDPGRPQLPEGIKLFRDSFQYKSGYFGACYVKSAPYGNDETFWVPCFAHRGTKDFEDDWLADIEIIMGAIPGQYDDALKFFMETVPLLLKLNPRLKDYKVFNHTGHSLGAIFAEIFASQLSSYEAMQFTYITLESPGSKPIIQKLIDRGSLPKNAIENAADNCVIINADIDIVNTCNEQVSHTWYAKVSYDYSVYGGAMFLVPKSYYQNYYYIKGYSFSDQHKILKLYNYLKEEITLFREPIQGWQNGYEAYLNYDERKEYWDGYMQYVWDNDATVREMFKQQIDDFIDFFIKTYLKRNDLESEITKKISLRKQISTFKQENKLLKNSFKLSFFELKNERKEKKRLQEQNRLLIDCFKMLNTKFKETNQENTLLKDIFRNVVTNFNQGEQDSQKDQKFNFETINL